MFRGVPKPIYGSCAKPCAPVVSCGPSIEALTAVLTSLIGLITSTQTVVDQFFPAVKAIAPMIVPMAASYRVNPIRYAYFSWAKAYPGKKFNINSEMFKLQLKDIYASMGLDWHMDPILNPPVVDPNAPSSIIPPPPLQKGTSAPTITLTSG